jgi:hypothetical protein
MSASKPRGDVAVGLGNVQAELKVKVESWGARCKVTCLGSEVSIDFHDDGGIEVIDPFAQSEEGERF